MAGLAFLAPGVFFFVGGLRGIVNPAALERTPRALGTIISGLLVAVVLTAMAAVCLGVAFQDDARGFQGFSFSFMGLGVLLGGGGSVTLGRIVFGIAGGLIGLLALLFWVISLIALASPRRGEEAPEKDLADPRSEQAQGRGVSAPKSVAPPPPPPPPALPQDPAADRAEIHEVLGALANAAFCEDNVRWRIHGIVECEGFYRVEAEPIPATVGYPRFRFVLARAADTGTFWDHGCFCLDHGHWHPLYTTPGTSEAWLILAFDEPR
jgi:hypothetical protein